MYEEAPHWRQCSVDGCDRMHAAKGLCDAHYNQQRLGRPLTALPPLADPLPRCAADGCTMSAIRGDLCGYHFHRWGNRRDDERPATPYTNVTPIDADARILTPRPNDTRLPIPPVCPDDMPLDVWARQVNAAWHATMARLDADADALERRQR